MSRYVAFLRGVNLGARNRVSMPLLREALDEAGFTGVATYVASGNVLLTSRAGAETVRRRVEGVVRDCFGLEIPVVVRTRDELAAVVRRNPLAGVATDPKRYQVTFLDREPAAELVRQLEEAAQAEERLVVSGREIYAWHPRTIARSRLWTLLAGRDLGITATARNWRTVTALLDLADDG